MSQENMESMDAAATAPRLSFEDACGLLKRQGRLISEDDIELVVLVTLHNEFLRLSHESMETHQQTIHEQQEKHQKAMTEIMKHAVEDVRKAIASEKEAFARSVREVGLENITALISQHQKDMAEHRQTIRFCTFSCCACLALMIFIFMRWL